jgi:predicted amidophosphoribosyltransferase
MVTCPQCGHDFEPMKLRCLRCGHEWYPRDLHKPPKVCPNPKCKSPYWDRERRSKKREKSISEENHKTQGED